MIPVSDAARRAKAIAYERDLQYKKVQAAALETDVPTLLKLVEDKIEIAVKAGSLYVRVYPTWKDHTMACIHVVMDEVRRSGYDVFLDAQGIAEPSIFISWNV